MFNLKGGAMSVGDTILKHRMEMGLTQDELSNRLNPPMTQAAVAAWEAGKSKPRYKVLSQLAQIFNISMVQLLDDIEVPEGAILPVPSTATLPLLNLGTVHAGEPKEAIEDDLVIQAPADVVSRHPSGFFLQVEGTCMDKAYPEGCHILVDPDMQPHNGSAVVAEFMGDTVLRRFHRFTDTLILSSDSTEPYPDIVVRGDMEVRILGVVVWFQASRDER